MTTNQPTCDASVVVTGFTHPRFLGPCILRYGHDGPVHKDANGATWTDHRQGPEPPRPVERCGEHDGPCFPDPDAQCSAHGEWKCAHCHRNPASCIDGAGECGMWAPTGMHWDTCPNRVRGPLADHDPQPEAAFTPARVSVSDALRRVESSGPRLGDPDDTDVSEAEIDAAMAAAVPVQIVTGPPPTYAAPAGCSPAAAETEPTAPTGDTRD